MGAREPRGSLREPAGSAQGASTTWASVQPGARVGFFAPRFSSVIVAIGPDTTFFMSHTILIMSHMIRMMTDMTKVMSVMTAVMTDMIWIMKDMT